MSNSKKGIDKKNIDEMSEKDMVMGIIHIVTRADLTYEQRRKIYEYTEKVLSEPYDEDNDTSES